MTIKVEFTADLPDTDATEEQIDQWLLFELHATYSMPRNPLSRFDLDAAEGSVRWRR